MPLTSSAALTLWQNGQSSNWYSVAVFILFMCQEFAGIASRLRFLKTKLRRSIKGLKPVQTFACRLAARIRLRFPLVCRIRSLLRSCQQVGGVVCRYCCIGGFTRFSSLSLFRPKTFFVYPRASRRLSHSLEVLPRASRPRSRRLSHIPETFSFVPETFRVTLRLSRRNILPFTFRESSARTVSYTHLTLPTTPYV